MKSSLYFFLILLISTTSCKIYNQNVLFKTDTEILVTPMEEVIKRAERNYVIQKNDYLSLRIFTNGGEQIIDPPPIEGTGTNAAVLNTQNTFRFLVEENGLVRFPLIGMIGLEGFTLHQADSLLALKYAAYYKDPYVVTAYLNKRVIVLRGTSGTLVPLSNENMTLIEVLAMTGGFNNNERANNIKLIRGDLQNPNVYIIDLSTIEGVKRMNLMMEPGDIVYVQPVRKTFLERLGDISPVLSFITTILTLTILFTK